MDIQTDQTQQAIIHPCRIGVNSASISGDVGLARPTRPTLRREDGGPEPTDSNLLSILELCDKRSVAEVSAHVHMPIGVVRVLLGDLIEQGHVRVQATLTADSSQDERRELIERTLRGLRTL